MRSRPARGRPTWWAILAVSLALMALVAATAARSNNALTPPKLATDVHGTTTTSSTTPKAEVTGTTVPTLVGATTPTTAPPVGAASGSSPISHAFGTTTTTVPALLPPATTTTTTTQPTSGEAVYPGYLQPPTQTSMTYQFAGTGPTDVSVTWSSSTYLSLHVTCSGFDQTSGGSSVISLSIPNAQGTCQAVLSEPAPATAVVSYTLTVNPGSGG